MKNETLQTIKTVAWFAGMFVAVGITMKGILKCTDNRTERSRTLVEKAEIYSKQGNYRDALEMLTSAVRADSTNVHAYIARAEAYLKSNEPEKALKDADKAVILSDSASAYLIRAEIRYVSGNLTDAFADYSETLRRDGKSAKGRLGTGNIYLKTGNVEKAIDAFTEAIETDATGEAYFARGNAHNIQGKYDEAINDFAKAASMDENNRQYGQAYEFALSLKHETN